MTAGTIVVDCALLSQPNAGTIDAIARLHLAARQTGLGLRFADPPPALLELLDFCGLSELLGVEPQRQTE